jgi:hypothetical protein
VGDRPFLGCSTQICGPCVKSRPVSIGGLTCSAVEDRAAAPAMCMGAGGLRGTLGPASRASERLVFCKKKAASCNLRCAQTSLIVNSLAYLPLLRACHSVTLRSILWGPPASLRVFRLEDWKRARRLTWC